MAKVFVVTGLLEMEDCLPEAHGFTDAFNNIDEAQTYMKNYMERMHPDTKSMMEGADDVEEFMQDREHSWYSPSLGIYFSQMIHEFDI